MIHPASWSFLVGITGIALLPMPAYDPTLPNYAVWKVVLILVGALYTVWVHTRKGR